MQYFLKQEQASKQCSEFRKEGACSMRQATVNAFRSIGAGRQSWAFRPACRACASHACRLMKVKQKRERRGNKMWELGITCLLHLNHLPAPGGGVVWSRGGAELLMRCEDTEQTRRRGQPRGRDGGARDGVLL